MVNSKKPAGVAPAKLYSTKKMLPIIQSLWVGRPLSQLEKLCIQSFLYHGHAFHLYVYDDIAGVPSGAVIKDANEVLPRSELFYLKKWGLVAPFSDWFRYALLAKNGYYWVDMDVVCLKPFDLKEDIVFAGSPGVYFGISILKFPKGHECMVALEESCRYYGKEMPWDDAGDKKRRRKIRLLGKSRSTAPYFLFGGSPVFTKAAKHFGLEKYCKPLITFSPHLGYGVHAFDRSFAGGIRLFEGAEAYALHFSSAYSSDLSGFDFNATFDAGSLFEQLKARYGVALVPNARKIDSATVHDIFAAPQTVSKKKHRKVRAIAAVILCIASFWLGYLL